VEPGQYRVDDLRRGVTMSAVNAWAGERRLVLSGKTFVLAASMDTIARLFDALGAETLAELGERLHGRKPKAIEAALAVFLGEAEAARALALAGGVAGLTAVEEALAGAMSGLTPEEEDEAKKADAARAEAGERAAVTLMAMMLTNSGASLSGTG